MPGVPVVVSINNSGDRRRKRKMAWAVIAGGKVEEGKVCVACAGKGVLEVPKEDVRPIQVRLGSSLRGVSGAGAAGWTRRQGGGVVTPTNDTAELCEAVRVQCA